MKINKHKIQYNRFLNWMLNLLTLHNYAFVKQIHNPYKFVILFYFICSLIVAQSLDGIKICIDPGHGGHSSNDRPPVSGSTYWESDGNWYKYQHTKEILESLGATVIVTRNGNTDSDDPALSVRAGIANSNNVDLFQSIHSNATGTSSRVNFTLVLYRGYDDAPVFPLAKSYATKVYRNFEKVNLVQDKSWDVIRGDWSFYPSWGTSGLGVLRGLTMPGVLSEGSFHDYVPEARRLKNSGYLRHEAWAITRAMLEHFGGGTLQSGIIAGILRDSNKDVSTIYQPLSELGDTKQPLNNIKVTLQPVNIVYNGDDQNNGYFMFDGVLPGRYKAYLEAENYVTDSVDITLSANNSLFIYKNLVYDSYNCADVSVEIGWNLLSVPNEPEKNSIKELFPNSISEAFIFEPGIGYMITDTIITGKGFWKKFPKQDTVQSCGPNSINNSIQVRKGWNLIGTISKDIPIIEIITNPVGIISAPIYGFRDRYYLVDTLEIGKGYWVKVSQDGELVYGNNTRKLVKRNITEIDEKWTTINIVDNEGSISTLYLSNEAVDLNIYELPPVPPKGIKDVRYGNESYLENLFDNKQIIKLQSLSYPIEISVIGMNVKIKDRIGGQIIDQVIMDGENIFISNPAIMELEIESIEIPANYELSQNYPNPFNPSTTIKFGLPEKTNVKLEIYNILGEKVGTLVNQEMDIGYHEIDFNAQMLSSGVYIYRLKTTEFLSEKKMVLLR